VRRPKNLAVVIAASFWPRSDPYCYFAVMKWQGRLNLATLALATLTFCH
jgi:hypothetical protein